MISPRIAKIMEDARRRRPWVPQPLEQKMRFDEPYYKLRKGLDVEITIYHGNDQYETHYGTGLWYRKPYFCVRTQKYMGRGQYEYDTMTFDVWADNCAVTCFWP